MRTKVVVTGTGIVCPAGNDSTTAWANLSAGGNWLRPMARYPGYSTWSVGEVSGLQAGPVLDAKTIRRSPLFVVYAAIAAAEAWHASGNDKRPFQPESAGTSIGTAHGSTLCYLDENPDFVVSVARGVIPRGLAFYPTAGLNNLAAGLISLTLGLQGPLTSSGSGMMSGLHALVDGYNAIRGGEAQMMLCGGADTPISPLGVAAYDATGSLCHGEYRPWHEASAGFSLGEGAAAFVLESEMVAVERGAAILAEFGGYGFRSCGEMEPTAEHWFTARWSALKQALDTAECLPSEIDAIFLDGWGLPASDEADRALVNMLERQGATPAALSMKVALGMSLGAASAMEIWAAVRAIHSGYLPIGEFARAPAHVMQGGRLTCGAAPRVVAVVSSAQSGSVGAVILKRNEHTGDHKAAV